MYFAPQFHAFRNMVLQGDESEFLASISRCRRWYSKGGKSNVYFAKTIDDRCDGRVALQLRLILRRFGIPLLLPLLGQAHALLLPRTMSVFCHFVVA